LQRKPGFNPKRFFLFAWTMHQGLERALVPTFYESARHFLCADARLSTSLSACRLPTAEPTPLGQHRAPREKKQPDFGQFI
jgi:hypothetical protein